MTVRPFEHKYASGMRTTYALIPGGGLAAVSLTIKSKIPLDEADTRYDAVKAAELEVAVVDYCKSRGNPYREVFFEEP